MYAFFGDNLVSDLGGAGIALTVCALACVAVPVILVLSILRNFAKRAAMLEGLGVIDSYKRGTKVLWSNIGQAIILFIIEVALIFSLFLLLIVPGLFVLICFCLWPIVFIVQGAVAAFRSSLWTLAWRTWTGEPLLVEKAPAA